MIRGVTQDHPWTRNGGQTSLPDAGVAADQLAAMTDATFGVLVGDHLLPSEGTGAARDRWKALWRLLGSPTFRDRTLDALESLLGEVESHLQAVPDDRAAALYHRRCEEAWSRLTRPVAARPAYGDLIAAIRAHRSEVLGSGQVQREADAELWRYLPSDHSFGR